MLGGVGSQGVNKGGAKLHSDLAVLEEGSTPTRLPICTALEESSTQGQGQLLTSPCPEGTQLSSSPYVSLWCLQSHCPSIQAQGKCLRESLCTGPLKECLGLQQSSISLRWTEPPDFHSQTFCGFLIPGTNTLGWGTPAWDEIRVGMGPARFTSLSLVPVSMWLFHSLSYRTSVDGSPGWFIYNLVAILCGHRRRWAQHPSIYSAILTKTPILHGL